MVTPAGLVWLFVLVEVLMAIAIAVLVGLVSSLVFGLRWNIKTAVADAALACLGYFAVGGANFVIAQFRGNWWPLLGEQWFFGAAAGVVVLKQLVRVIQKPRRKPGKATAMNGPATRY